jgi:hypothetical protein
MKVIYTETAEREMQSFHEKQKRLLEELIAEKKFVYGDETLEITASDIKQAADQIQAYRPTSRRHQVFLFASRIYIAIGILVMVGAYFFPKLQAMVFENKTQGLLFMMGAVLAFAGIVLSVFYQIKFRRYDEIRRETFRTSEEVGLSAKALADVVKELKEKNEITKSTKL